MHINAREARVLVNFMFSFPAASVDNAVSNSLLRQFQRALSIKCGTQRLQQHKGLLSLKLSKAVNMVMVTYLAMHPGC